MRVTLYHSPGCHLCDRARDVVLGVQTDTAFELVEVDISGDESLEARYRALLPVVEVEGGRSFSYFVPEDAFRRAVAAQSPGSEPSL
ncbi:MAG TPA: glutaredoxin family protein [Gaiellaceae bacterium]|nr:glutaredoxin family protein [Gaiellaceae bacterium]